MNVVLTAAGPASRGHVKRAANPSRSARRAASRSDGGRWSSLRARVLTRAGYKGHFLNACGYTLGGLSADVDGRAHDLRGQRQELAPGMVFFIHMIL